MDNATPSTPQSKSRPQSQLLPPDTQPAQRFTSQSEYRTGDLSLGRQAVLKDLGRYLRVPYATLIRSVLGSLSPTETSGIRQKLTENGILNFVGGKSQWAAFTVPPARSNVSESVAFQPLIDIISTIFNEIHNCPVSFTSNPSATPLSERGNTSRPDACIVHGRPAANQMHWFDIVVPFEFKKTKDHSAKYDNERKMIWSLHHIMREDPLRRFALGISIEDADMRIWCSNRAFLAISMPIDFTAAIDDVISLFYLIGKKNKEELGWDPTVERVHDGTKIQYRFKIGNRFFTTTRPLATYGADAMVGRGTRVYEALDENKNIVAIKDSWREEDREPEGAILENIFKDIRDKLGEKEAAEAAKYFVAVQVYEDVAVSGECDKTFNLKGEGDICLEWITIKIDPILSERRHLPSKGHIPESDYTPTELARVRAPSADIPCRVHTRTVFGDVGIPLMKVTCLSDAFTCLSGVRQALYYVHKAGWVHRDFSVANALWAETDDQIEGQMVGKLTDFEYAKKVNSEVSHDVRTGTMHFMALEVEYQQYLFLPEGSQVLPLDPPSPSSICEPPFRMNLLHDLESLWWGAIWILFYHTDADSPAENLDAQLRYFNQAFPRAIAQGSRQNFFTKFPQFLAAYGTLSATYRSKCAAVLRLGVVLRKFYEKVEKSFPLLLIDDNLLQDVHKEVLDAYSDALTQLNDSNIRLQPLHELQETKRNLDDSPTHRAAKKVRRAK